MIGKPSSRHEGKSTACSMGGNKYHKYCKGKECECPCHWETMIMCDDGCGCGWNSRNKCRCKCHDKP